LSARRVGTFSRRVPSPRPLITVNMAKADFYESYVGAVKALSVERVKEYLDTIKKGKVVLMQADCYAIKSDTINEIIGKNSPQNSSYFATLYQGWPLDSQANPLRVKALFKHIHGTNSTSGGAIVPCSVIDAHGLQVQVSPMHRRVSTHSIMTAS
jgi:hypothetical protein